MQGNTSCVDVRNLTDIDLWCNQFDCIKLQLHAALHCTSGETASAISAVKLTVSPFSFNDCSCLDNGLVLCSKNWCAQHHPYPGMNKAFTKEADSDDDEDSVVSPLPVGGKNYITRQGYERLRDELLRLIDSERPKVVDIVHWAASNGDRSENGDYLYGKKRLREIDRRIRFLTQRLEISVISNPSIHHGSDQAFFGATVTYVDSQGLERIVTILGVDEAISGLGQVSWVSPVARALLKSRVGDEVTLVTPQGTQVLQVLKVDYPAADSMTD